MSNNNSANYQAKLSALVKPREGRCLNVMDAAAHAAQAQHRNRYVGVSIAPMFKGVNNDFKMAPQHAY